MRRICSFAFAVSLALTAPLLARGAETGGILLVLPFENTSKVAGIDWIRESFPEIIGDRLKAAPILVVRREDRNYAFDHLGIPTNIRLSRATLYKIAEQMDTDLLVFGSYHLDGDIFTASAQLLDMKRLRLLPEVRESGPLTSLIEIESALSWDLLHSVDPESTLSRDNFAGGAPAVQLNAFENYLRGAIEPNTQEKVKHFKEAIRINPQYDMALLQLGKTLYSNREYDAAAGYLAKIARTDAMASEAQFYLGLCSYYLGQFDKAEDAFNFVSSKLPLTEVFNNLGVIAARRGKRSAIEYFQKAILEDPNDPDYHFNLAVSLNRNGDTASAVRHLHDVLTIRPSDQEAKALLDSLSPTPATAKIAVPPPGPSAPTAIAPPLKPSADKPPAERIKRNYEETSYRQAMQEIQKLQEIQRKMKSQSQ